MIYNLQYITLISSMVEQDTSNIPIQVRLLNKNLRLIGM